MVVLQQLFGAFCIIFPSLIYANFIASSLSRAVSVLGVICTAACLVSYGAPLSDIKRVVQTKSAESMSLQWCLISTITALLWTIYGHLRHDSNIIVSSFILAFHLQHYISYCNILQDNR